MCATEPCPWTTSHEAKPYAYALIATTAFAVERLKDGQDQSSKRETRGSASPSLSLVLFRFLLKPMNNLLNKKRQRIRSSPFFSLGNFFPRNVWRDHEHVVRNGQVKLDRLNSQNINRGKLTTVFLAFLGKREVSAFFRHPV